MLQMYVCLIFPIVSIFMHSARKSVYAFNDLSQSLFKAVVLHDVFIFLSSYAVGLHDLSFCVYLYMYNIIPL